MIEVRGDMWKYAADARVVTTNGYIRKDGAAVMGRGVARQCMRKYKGIEFVLGELIRQGGNTVHLFGIPPMTDIPIYSFPVKWNFWEVADLGLIGQSARELMSITPLTYTVVIPRPGCGNGQLKWEDVKPVIEDILDDRFHVIDLP